MIKYTKNVLWLKEYVDSVSDIVPIENIKRIKGYKVALGMGETQDAAIHVANNRGDKFNITIKLYDQILKDGKLVHQPVHLARALDSLAHEISHCLEFEHTRQHYLLQLRIMKRFDRVMKKHGVEDTWDFFTKVYQ